LGRPLIQKSTGLFEHLVAQSKGKDLMFYSLPIGEEFDMDWDDEYNDGYDDTGHISGTDESMPDKTGAEGGFDPMDIVNPVSAYFFLSDDAQDEIGGEKRKGMKCLSCGHRFMGEIYDNCPECFSSDTEEADEKDHGYW